MFSVLKTAATVIGLECATLEEVIITIFNQQIWLEPAIYTVNRRAVTVDVIEFSKSIV